MLLGDGCSREVVIEDVCTVVLEPGVLGRVRMLMGRSGSGGNIVVVLVDALCLRKKRVELLLHLVARVLVGRQLLHVLLVLAAVGVIGAQVVFVGGLVATGDDEASCIV